MDDNNLYALVWKLVIFFLCLVVMVVGGLSASEHYQIRKLIEATGADPVAARCAILGQSNRILGQSNSSAICTILALRVEREKR